MNTLKTGFLLTILTLILIFAGRALGGQQGMIIAFFFALMMNGISYWFSDKIILTMYGAREVSASQAPELHRIVANLSQRANLPMPKVYFIPSQSPNAFATGRNPQHAAVAVTKGLMEILDEDKLEGVIGHELSHIKNRDILIACVAATVAGAITVLAQMGRFAMIFGGGRGARSRDGIVPLLMIIIAPIAALIIQMWISRTREYQADENAASLTGKPLALADALRSLETYSKRIPLSASPATAHLFIVNPLRDEGLLTLFSTHPPLKDRILRLEGLARG